MQRLLTEAEKAEIIEREWAKARAKNPKVIMRVNVQDETDESGKPRVSVVIACSETWMLRGSNPATCRRGDRVNCPPASSPTLGDEMQIINSTGVLDGFSL
jgi:hypothetical protein